MNGSDDLDVSQYGGPEKSAQERMATVRRIQAIRDLVSTSKME